MLPEPPADSRPAAEHELSDEEVRSPPPRAAGGRRRHRVGVSRRDGTADRGETGRRRGGEERSLPRTF